MGEQSESNPSIDNHKTDIQDPTKKGIPPTEARTGRHVFIETGCQTGRER